MEPRPFSRRRALRFTLPLAMLSAAAATSVASRATADSHFAPMTCSQLGQLQAYDWKVGIDDTSDVPVDPVGRQRYDNQQSHTRYLLTNQNVTWLATSFSSFDTEANFDKLAFGGIATPSVLTGALGTPMSTFYSRLGSFQASPLSMQFTSDYSVTHRGFDLSALTVGCSGSSSSAITSFPPGHGRIDGVLLGKNDVVYTSFTTDSTDAHYSLAMWSPSTAGGQDFDVYAACGRRPSATDYDLVSNAGPSRGNSEFIHIDPAIHPCASTWQVAVLSYGNAGASGQGYFHLLWSKHRPSQDARYTVGITNPTAADLATAESYLSDSAKMIFGATNGQVLLTYDIYNVPGANQKACRDDASWVCNGAHCNVCMRSAGSGGGGSGWADRIDMPWDTWHSGHPGSFAHEFGHAHLGLGDDYVGISDSRVQLPTSFPTRPCMVGADCPGVYGNQCTGVDLFEGTSGTCTGVFFNSCGHSMMANSYLESDYCTTFNHFYDARYVQQGYETNVFTWPTDATLAYDQPLSLAGSAQSYVPRSHSTYWSDKSDYQTGIANGVLLYEPGGSPDPYRFQDDRDGAFESWVGRTNSYNP